MKSVWLRILLLCTFAYWGTGTAKFLHELVEHHGGRDDAAAVDDDDDGDIATVVAHVNAVAAAAKTLGDSSPASSSSKPLRHDHTCFLCQQISAMTAEYGAPPALPVISLDVVATLVVPDWRAPIVSIDLLHPARGPPALSFPAT